MGLAISKKRIPTQQKLLKKIVQWGIVGKQIHQLLCTSQLLFTDAEKILSQATVQRKIKHAQPGGEKQILPQKITQPTTPSKKNGVPSLIHGRRFDQSGATTKLPCVVIDAPSHLLSRFLSTVDLVSGCSQN